MTDKILEALQVKVSFLEDALGQLSEEHYKQQQEIDRLKRQYLVLVDRLTHQDSGHADDTALDDQKPPHY